MSYTWAADWRGEDEPRNARDDEEPRDLHPESCAIWQSPDPAAGCNCGSFQAGVERQVNLFESYAPQRSDGAP